MENELNIKLQLQPTNLATKNTSDFTITEAGDAFVSQRKLSDMIGVPRTTIMNFVNRNGPVQSDVSQGLSPKMVTKMVQYFSSKGKPRAIEFLSKLAEAGAKAWIYHEAGYQLDAKPKPQEMTKKEIILMALEIEEENIQLRSEVKIAAPKVECFDQIADSSNLIGMNNVAKTLNIKGLGRNKLFKLLREKNILNHKNIPYQRFIESGYFEVKVSSYYNKYLEDNVVNHTTYVTSKGLIWLQRTIKNDPVMLNK